jgi:ADP-ribose pyrophosphatase
MTKWQDSPVVFSKSDVEMLDKKTVYKGFFKLNRYTFRHRMFDGKQSDIVVREIFERGNAVVLLPYDPVRDEVVLIEQIRIAAVETSHSPWLLELVAGMVEEGETDEDVARREAQEEAGIEVGRCKRVLSYLASPGGTSERLFVMVGEVDATKASGIHGLAQENEDIKVHVVSRQQAYRWVEQGIIDNAASVIALQWLALNHKNLVDEWR